MQLARLACLALYLLAAESAHATWTQVQTAGGTCATGTTTCTVNWAIGATQQGSVIVVILGMSGVAVLTAASDNAPGGSSTYTIPANNACVAIENVVSNNTVSCAYTTNSSGGATSVTTTRDASAPAGQLRALEFTSTVAGVAFDTAGSAIDSGTPANPVGPALTPTGTNLLVIQSGRGNVMTAISPSPPYTMNVPLTITRIAWALDMPNAPQATWTQTAGRAAMIALAFREPIFNQPSIDVITENLFPDP